MADYRGFQAVVQAVDRARESFIVESDKQILVFRAIRDDARLQLPVLDRIAESLRARAERFRENVSAAPRRLEVRNLKLEAGSVKLTARNVIVETRGRLTGDRQEKRDDERLAKSIGEQIKNIKVKGGGLGNPLQLIGLGLFTGIGFQFGANFARGFEQTFSKKTGFSSKGAGKAIGDVVGTPIEKIQSLELPEKLKESADYFLKKFRSVRYALGEAIASAIEDEGDFSSKAKTFGKVLQEEGQKFSNGISDDLEKAGENFLNILKTIPSVLTSPFDNLLRGLRQEALQDIGADLVKERAQVIAKENKQRSSVRAIDENTEELVIAVGGYAGARGLSGQRIPKILLDQAEDNVAAIAVNNPSSDIPKEVLEDRDKRLKASFSSVARPNIRGYSPDAIEMAAQALAALEKSPEIKIKLVGESGGGFIAEEATALLNILGYGDRVQGVGVGTPELIGGLNLKNFSKLLSPDDPLGHVAEKFADFGLAKQTPDQQIRGATEHPIEGYINLPEVRQKLFGDSKTTAGDSRKVLEFVNFNVKASEKATTESGKNYYKNQFEANLKEVQERIQSATGKTVLKNLRQAEELLQSALDRLQAPDEPPKEESPKKLIDRYLVYIDKLIEKAREEAADRISVLVPNYADLTVPEKRQFAQQFSADIAKEVKKFRMAVEDEEGEISVEIGERILGMIQPIRKIYEDLLENLPADYSGTRSIRGQLTNLTAIQNEVLRGQPNQKGRAKKGLTQIVGDETAEGLIEGIEARLSEVEASGEEMGQAAIDGAKNRLGIASPSKEFEEIGRASSEGYTKGLDESEGEVKSALDRFWDTLENIPILGWFVKAGRAIGQFIANLFGPDAKIGKKTNRTDDSKSDQIPVEPNSQNRPRQNPDQPTDRPADAGDLGRVELPDRSPDLGDTQAPETRRGRTGPVAGEFNPPEQVIPRQLEVDRSPGGKLAPLTEAFEETAKRVKAELEIAPGVWADTEKLNDSSLKRQIERQLALFWEKFRRNIGTEVRRTLMTLTFTVPGAIIGRGVTGTGAGGFAGGLAGRLIGETGFDDITNFQSVRKEGLSPATKEFWEKFGENRQFLPNKLRKAAIGYGAGAVVGRGVTDTMQVIGADKWLSALLPSWLENLFGDAISRVVKTIADPNIDLAIPKLPAGMNHALSAPLHAIGSGVGENFVGNFGLSFLEGQTRTALLPVRDVLLGAGRSIGGEGLFGGYLGDRLESIGVGTIQELAPAAGRGIAGMIAPGMPANIRDFIADQLVSGTVMDGAIRGQIAPYLAGKAGADIFGRAVKIPLSGNVSGRVNKALDQFDPFPIAPPPPSDEQLLAEREKRILERRKTSVFQGIDTAIESTADSIVGAGQGVINFFDRIRLKGHQFAQKVAGLEEGKEAPKVVDRYYVYLDKLIEKARESAEKKIATLVPNYSSLTIPERKDFAQRFRGEIGTEIKKFRMAVEDEEGEIAVEIGERILGMIAPVRKIYEDLLENLPEDYSGTRSIRGQLSNLTAIQNEVLRGQPNQKGRAAKGLTQIVGDETAEGLIQGIEARLNEVEASGEKLGEAAIDGAKDRLGIASPSRVFQEIGENVVEGFERGVDELGAVTVEQIGNFARATDRGVASFIDKAKETFDSFINGLYERFPVLKELQDLILGIGASFLIGNALEAFVGWVTELGSASFDAVLELESMRRALSAVSGGAEQGARGLAFVREEARPLGIDLRTAEEAYAGLKAATQFSSIRGAQSDRVFSTFAETASLRGLSKDQQGNLFRALSQIANKPLSAEEVKGQLGEIPALAFESTLARSLGVSVNQLSDIYREGKLQGADILPKVAALYQAENAAIAGSSDTTAQAMTRYQNSILNLQRAFEGWVAGSRPFFNAIAGGLEKITELIPTLLKYVGILSTALFLETLEFLATSFIKSATAQALFVNGLKAVASLVQYVIPQLLAFAKTFVLVTLAVDAWTNVISLASNPFPELQKNLEQTTARANALQKALAGVGKTTQEIKPDLPATEDRIITSKTWEIFGQKTPLSLDYVRKGIDLVARPFGGAFLTAGQKELADFQVFVGDTLAKIDQGLAEQFNVEKVLEDIKKIDKELTTVRSRRFNIPAGDTEAYNASIEAEQRLLEQRDELLGVTAQFQQNLQGDKTSIEATLKLLDELVAKKGITAEAEASIRSNLETRLEDIEKTNSAFEDLTSSLAQSVNALSLALRNLNENAASFNENLERSATNTRVQFLRRARAAGLGSQLTDVGIDQIDRGALESRLVFLRDQLAAVSEYLTKPDFSALLDELRQQAEDAGLNLENTATIDRLLQENRSQQETAVLEALKEQLRLKDELGQTEESLERSISSARSTLTDLNRSVEDFFFNLTQQIREALVEVDRILDRLKYGNLKTRLQRALVPGSDTFVNGLVSQIQGIFDQASNVLEQVLGQRSARISFAGERRGLQSELENFTRGLGGATEAIEAFRSALLGAGSQGSGGGGQGSGGGSPLTVGTVGATGIGTGPHLDIRGRDPRGNRLTETRLRELLSLVYVGGKPLSAQTDRITSGYGDRVHPVRGGRSHHPALDFRFSEGTPIEFRGQATAARNFFDKNGGGNVVEITLPTGEKLQLLHLDKVGDLGTIQTARTGGNTRSTPRDYGPYTAMILKAAQAAGVDPDLFAALIRQESNFRQNNPKTGRTLMSSAGALGLSQLMPGTARELGVNPYDPQQNLTGGARYLRQQLDRFGGNVDLALAAYNAGPGNVQKHGGIPPFRETRNYVANIRRFYREFQGPGEAPAGQVAGRSVTIPTAPIPAVNAPAIPTVNTDRARDLTDTLVKVRERQISLGDASVRQEIENFIINLQQTRETILRQMGDTIRTTRESVIDARNSLIDARSQYAPQTQSSQLESDLRNIDNQFRSFDTQFTEQERGLQDNITGLTNLLGQIQPVIEILKASGNSIDRQSAEFLEGLTGQISRDRDSYRGMLAEIQALRGQLQEGKLDAEGFVRAQARLREVQADLERIGIELTVAQGQNNAELQRSIGLLQSRQQLEADILQISNDFADNEVERERRIGLAREQAKIREQEIEYQFQSNNLAKELDIISQRLALSQNLSNLGKRNELQLLESQKQLEQQILEIKKQYPDLAEQELRIQLAREAAAQREQQFENDYRNQKLQREGEILDLDGQIAEGTAARLESEGDIFGANSLREQAAFAAELLRYEQQIEEIRQRYPDDPLQANELIRKATTLRDLNLEAIDRQFKDLGETISDIGAQAFGTFIEDVLTGTKSIGEAFADMARSVLAAIAQIAAKIAIVTVFRAIAAGFGGGFAEGGTVGGVDNFADGGEVETARNAVIPFRGIQEALRREGPRGVLAVFTPGEEILSTRLGEAQRYQRLKARFGKNPLAKIGNFMDGGTISDNLLASLGPGSIGSSSRLPTGFGQTTNNNYREGDRSVHVHVSTPDAGGFRRSERAIGREIAEYLRRV